MVAAAVLAIAAVAALAIAAVAALAMAAVAVPAAMEEDDNALSMEVN